MNHKNCAGLHSEFIPAGKTLDLKPEILYVCHDHAVCWTEKVRVIDPNECEDEKESTVKKLVIHGKRGISTEEIVVPDYFIPTRVEEYVGERGSEVYKKNYSMCCDEKPL